MSNDLIISSKAISILPGGKTVEIINAPLRSIAPIMRDTADCFSQCTEYCKDVPTMVERRDLLWPRAVAVAEAHRLLTSICKGEQNIDARTAMRMISVMLKVLGKKRDGDSVSLFSFVSLFDPEIDSLGPSLGLWKEVPKHPIVVALGIQRLYHKQVYAPTPSEFCDACRRAAERLDDRRDSVWHWLIHLRDIDMELFRKDRDAWASMYATPEGREAAAAFDLRINSDRNRRGIMEILDKRDAAFRELTEGV